MTRHIPKNMHEMYKINYIRFSGNTYIHVYVKDMLLVAKGPCQAAQTLEERNLIGVTRKSGFVHTGMDMVRPVMPW